MQNFGGKICLQPPPPPLPLFMQIQITIRAKFERKDIATILATDQLFTPQSYILLISNSNSINTSLESNIKSKGQITILQRKDYLW